MKAMSLNEKALQIKKDAVYGLIHGGRLKS